MRHFPKLMTRAEQSIEDCKAEDGQQCVCPKCEEYKDSMRREWIALGKPSAPKPDISEQEITVCIYCNHEVRGIGDDGISFCEEGGCGVVEGQTKTITEAEYEELHA